jgi:hypothetical protein
MGIGHQLSITGDQWKSILCKVASLAAFFPLQRFGLRWSVGAVLMEDGLAVEFVCGATSWFAVFLRREFRNADEDSQRRRREKLIFVSEIIGVKNGLEG